MKTYLKNERVARRENIRASVCAARMLSLRPDKRSRRDGGHAPPQRHLERSAATTKTRFTGRKQNKRERILLSSRHSTKEGFTGRKRVKRKRLPVVFPSFSERGLTGENARANAVSGRALSPVKRKWGLTGEKTHERATRSEGVCSPVIILQSSPRPSRGSLPFCDGRNNRANSRCSRESRQSRCPEFPPKQAELL